MMLCLLVGSILAVAMVSSIPMYTGGVLQRMMLKDLEAYQARTQVYAGRYSFACNYYSIKEENRLAAFHIMDQRAAEYVDALPIPAIQSVRQISLDYFTCMNEEDLPAFQVDDRGIKRQSAQIDGLSNYQDHIVITNGRMPAKEKVGDYYEVIITKKVMKEMNFLLDGKYALMDIVTRTNQPILVHIVGIFDSKEGSELYWQYGLRMVQNGFVMDDELLFQDFINIPKTMLTNVRWTYALDYHKLTLDRMKSMVQIINAQQAYLKANTAVDFTAVCMDTISSYTTREVQLKLTLWVLQVPILLMLAFYIFMVSQLIIEYEKNTIAVMKSRGASKRQIFITYLIQSLLINSCALVLGLGLSYQLCRFIGSSNGFLTFVQRTALPIAMSPSTVLYGAAAALFSVVTMLIPAIAASRATIVEQKRKKGRFSGVPFWKKLFLDVILTGVALYGLDAYQKRQVTLGLSGLDASQVPLDPILFVISTLFIIGCGLLMLRIYPYVVRLIFRLGRRWWSPELYASFIQVGRSGGGEQFLMIFLVLTLSVGIFSANAARTINRNVEEKIFYEIGADAVVTTQWQSNVAPQSSADSSAAGSMSITKILYKEPPFTPFKDMPSAEQVARVYTQPKAVITASMGGTRVAGKFMAVHPLEFGEVVWSRSSLLPYHINDYLNMLAAAPSTVILSSKCKEDMQVKVGDAVFVNWEGASLSMVVGAFVDYWPSMNPYEKDSEYFAIGNFEHLLSQMPIQPYQIWVKAREDATSAALYEELITASGNTILTSRNARQEVITLKNDPMLQGLNGSLTMGFIVTMSVSAIGFVIYWVLSIQGRVLQFGIFRAVGMRMRQIIGMLIGEQILISFVAILAGIVIGGITCDLFVPLLQIAYATAAQVPPFQVVASPEDYNRIYLIVGCMLAGGFAILGVLISKINISQALKLGED